MTTFRSLGDLSTTFLLSRQTATLKAEVQGRATELSSGKVADLSKALRGDYRTLNSIETRIGLAGAEKLAITEARGLATAAQDALGLVQDRADAVAGVMLGIPFSPTSPTLDRAGSFAHQAFEAIVSGLNQKNADRAVFAGDATDAVALASVDTMMADIEAAIATETTAAGVAAAVDAWFDTPGIGFDALGYTGSDTALAPLNLGAGEAADFPITAADQNLRDMMKGFAMGALLDGPALAGDVDERLALARVSAERVLTAKGGVTDIRASIGAAEATIEAARSRAEAEVSALEIARSDLIGADPFDAATKLESAQTQLETLFALTARVSRMSLVDYLR